MDPVYILSLSPLLELTYYRYYNITVVLKHISEDCVTQFEVKIKLAAHVLTLKFSPLHSCSVMLV